MFQLFQMSTGNISADKDFSCNEAKSPEKFWYEQSYTEWVLLVRGHAVLAFEGGERLELNEGDYLAIPPHARHRIDETGPETIWLVVHLTGGA